MNPNGKKSEWVRERASERARKREYGSSLLLFISMVCFNGHEISNAKDKYRTKHVCFDWWLAQTQFYGFMESKMKIGIRRLRALDYYYFKCIPSAIVILSINCAHNNLTNSLVDFRWFGINSSNECVFVYTNSIYIITAFLACSFARSLSSH